MSLGCPPLQSTAIISDDVYLAARLSSALAKRGSYLAVMDGPRMTRPDRGTEVIRRNNALARVHADVTLLAGLPDEARAAMLAQLPAKRVREVTNDDVPNLIADQRIRDSKPLRWGKDRVGVGLLKALYGRQLIEFTNEPSPNEAVPTRSGHVVVCEVGEPISEVIAANYAYALEAGLCLIDPTDEVESRALCEAYYNIDAPGVDPQETRDRLQARLRELCGAIDIPKDGSLTFISRRLPLGLAFPELPSTHLFQYPDLGIAVVNGFAAEQKGTRGVNIAVIVDPEKVRAPEIEAATKLLPKRGVFLRGYSGKGADVRAVSEMIERFPYDLLIFATHCGDASGYRWTYKFRDSEGVDRTLVVDIAIGVAQTDDPEMLKVSQFLRFHSLDGVDWSDPVEKAKLHVGMAIRDFMDRYHSKTIEPVEKDTVPRVIGSAAMAMADNNLIVMPRSLAVEGTPIIINNACVSWHQLASRFTFADARAYVGTLYPISDLEAEAVVVRLLDEEFGKFLPHALWNAQRAAYGKTDNRRPYVMTGVYTQRLRVTKENVPFRIMRHMTGARHNWKSKQAEAAKAGDEKSEKHFAEISAFYDREIAEFRKRWFASS